MFDPVAAAVGVVQHQRLQIIHSMCILCFGRLSRFKLLKDGGQFFFLIRGQQRKDPLLRCRFPLLLRSLGRFVVSVGIAGIDLHQIMDQTHDHHMGDVNRLVGVLLQQIRHDRHVPGVLGIVFLSSVAGQRRLAKDVFLLVDLQCKGHLFV